MAAVWRRAWRSKKVPSTGLGSGSGSGSGGSLWPISGTTTTTPSGTTFSTTAIYTTISCDPVGERPLAVEESAGEGLDLDAMEFEELVEMRQHLRGLVAEFCGGASGNVTAPNRWLSELNVAWLLHLSELGASARAASSHGSCNILCRVGSWLYRKSTHLSGHALVDFRQEEATVAPPASPEFLRFIQATLCKMLTFVGAVVAVPLNVDDPSSQEHIVSTEAGQLRALLDVRESTYRLQK